MAGEEILGQEIALNMSEAYASLWDSLPPTIMNNLDKIVELGVILIIASIAYLTIIILIKIIGFFVGSREARRLNKIGGQLDEIIALLKSREKKGKGAGGNFKKHE